MTQAPIKDFTIAFKDAIVKSGMTHYGIGHMWAAETDESPNTLRVRVDSWVRKLPKSICGMILLLDCLGYRLRIEKK
jgi:hypothetical protein